MYSLDALMNKTPGDVITRSKWVNVFLKGKPTMKKRGDLNTLQFVVTCVARTDVPGYADEYTKLKYKNKPKQTYDVVIEFFPTEMKKDVFAYPNSKAAVWVQCSCPFFFYYNMYALARVGSTELTDKHNGARAYIKNPENHAYLCKHLYAAAPLCLAQAKAKAQSSSTGKYSFVNK